jgi:membrane protein
MATKAATHDRAGGKAQKREKGLRDFASLWARLFREHDLGTFSVAIAYGTIVASVALVLLGLGLLGLAGRHDVWTEQLAPHVQGRVLPGVFDGLNQTVDRIFAHSTVSLIMFATLLAIWEVSRAVRVTMTALNRIYETEEKREWWQRWLLSGALSIPLIAALLGAVLLVVAAGGAVEGPLQFPIDIARWVVAILLVGLAFGLVVRFAPQESRATRWVSIGATVAVVGWLLEALAFRWYVGTFADFKTATGSLTIVLVVSAYYYGAALILLLGIEADELVRRDSDGEDRSLHELVRDVLGR